MMSTRGTKYVFPLVSRCCEWCRCLYVDQKGHHCYFFPLEHGKRVVTPRRKSCSPHSISPAPQRRGVPELIQIRTRAVHDQEAWADRRHGQHSARGGHVWVRVRAVRFPQFVRSSIELTKSGCVVGNAQASKWVPKAPGLLSCASSGHSTLRLSWTRREIRSRSTRRAVPRDSLGAFI